MTHLKYYNVDIAYNGSIRDPIVEATITMPDGSERMFKRHAEIVEDKIADNKFTVKNVWYTTDTPTGISTFTSFDNLMFFGFRLTRKTLN
jgi:hypothetical protein